MRAAGLDVADGAIVARGPRAHLFYVGDSDLRLPSIPDLRAIVYKEVTDGEKMNAEPIDRRRAG